jgi:hypothetical protein
MKTHKAAEWFVVVVSVSAVLFIVSTTAEAQGLGTGGVNVLTWHNDAYRTGDNLGENTITPSSIQTDNFGQLCAANLDGQVYAQPLVATDVSGAEPWGGRS